MSIKIANTLIVIFILLQYNIVNGQKAREIEIKGKLKNFKERVVEVIFRWKKDGQYYKDSCTVKHSKYIFKTKISEPTGFSLRAKYLSKTGNYYYKLIDESYESMAFFLEPKKIHLTSIDSFTNTICTGSASNMVAVNYRKEAISSTEIDDKASKIFYSLKLSNTDSLDVIEKLKDSLSLAEDVKRFKKYAKTVFGSHLLNTLYDQRYSVTKLKELFNLLSEEGKLTNSAQLLFKKLNSYTPLAIGQNFEWFTMADTSGVAINVANTGHKIILVDFWASWCTPCRQQMPELKEIYNKFHNKGFEIVAVSLDEKIDNWKKAIVHDKVPWINVSDLKGWNSELITKSYIQSIPFNIFIDSDGKIIGIDLSMNDLLKKCKDLMPL
ncbi:MAG: hypothetical protein RL115_2119 [Bacteroidota bacterium]|jgi:thiol-disulfide isomerase/thioredoxin